MLYNGKSIKKTEYRWDPNIKDGNVVVKKIDLNIQPKLKTRNILYSLGKWVKTSPFVVSYDRIIPLDIIPIKLFNNLNDSIDNNVGDNNVRLNKYSSSNEKLNLYKKEEENNNKELYFSKNNFLFIYSNLLRIIRFELITLRLKGEYSTNWVTFPNISRKLYFLLIYLKKKIINYFLYFSVKIFKYIKNISIIFFKYISNLSIKYIKLSILFLVKWILYILLFFNIIYYIFDMFTILSTLSDIINIMSENLPKINTNIIDYYQKIHYVKYQMNYLSGLKHYMHFHSNTILDSNKYKSELVKYNIFLDPKNFIITWDNYKNSSLYLKLLYNKTPDIMLDIDHIKFLTKEELLIYYNSLIDFLDNESWIDNNQTIKIILENKITYIKTIFRNRIMENDLLVAENGIINILKEIHNNSDSMKFNSYFHSLRSPLTPGFAPLSPITRKDVNQIKTDLYDVNYEDFTKNIEFLKTQYEIKSVLLKRRKIGENISILEEITKDLIIDDVD